jgi:hypothetical protein
MPNALESGAAKTAEEEAHRRRWAHLQEAGWKLTSQGLVLDRATFGGGLPPSAPLFER